MSAAKSKFSLGWHVTNTSTGITGKIVDKYIGSHGVWEYKLQVPGARNFYITYAESALVRQGNQFSKR